jgi:hypothetical protein
MNADRRATNRRAPFSCLLLVPLQRQTADIIIGWRVFDFAMRSRLRYPFAASNVEIPPRR